MLLGLYDLLWSRILWDYPLEQVHVFKIEFTIISNVQRGIEDTVLLIAGIEKKFTNTSTLRANVHKTISISQLLIGKVEHKIGFFRNITTTLERDFLDSMLVEGKIMKEYITFAQAKSVSIHEVISCLTALEHAKVMDYVQLVQEIPA